MKIENIKFNQVASNRVYSDYMKRVKKAISSLSQQNQDDIYMEINSHIFEAIQHKNQINEIDTLLDILDKLGAPEEVLKPLVADKKLEQASKTFNPIHVFKALLLNVSNGFIYIFLTLLFIFLISFPVLIILKLIYPKNVGCYIGDNTFFFGYSSAQNNVTEILGNWFIPSVLLIGISLYILIVLIIKFLKNKK